MKELGNLLRFIGICCGAAALIVVMMATRSPEQRRDFPNEFFLHGKNARPQFVEPWVNPTLIVSGALSFLALVVGAGLVNTAEGRPFFYARPRRDRDRS